MVLSQRVRLVGVWGVSVGRPNHDVTCVTPVAINGANLQHALLPLPMQNRNIRPNHLRGDVRKNFGIYNMDWNPCCQDSINGQNIDSTMCCRIRLYGSCSIKFKWIFFFFFKVTDTYYHTLITSVVVSICHIWCVLNGDELKHVIKCKVDSVCCTLNHMCECTKQWSHIFLPTKQRGCTMSKM